MMLWLDSSSSVVWWSSEELVVWYKSPMDNRIRRYFPDFFVCLRGSDGVEKTKVVELKPNSETQEPKRPKQITEAYVRKVQTWGKNQAKWSSAQAYCKARGYEFKVLTEKDIGV